MHYQRICRMQSNKEAWWSDSVEITWLANLTLSQIAYFVNVYLKAIKKWIEVDSGHQCRLNWLQYPFPPFRRILMHVLSMTFKNIVAKGEISHNEQFLLARMFSILIIILSFLEMFNIFSKIFPKSSVVELLFVTEVKLLHST